MVYIRFFRRIYSYGNWLYYRYTSNALVAANNSLMLQLFIILKSVFSWFIAHRILMAVSTCRWICVNEVTSADKRRTGARVCACVWHGYITCHLARSVQQPFCQHSCHKWRTFDASVVRLMPSIRLTLIVVVVVNRVTFTFFGVSSSVSSHCSPNN